MSFFSWLSPKKPAKQPAPPPSSSGLSRMESTKPFDASRHGVPEANAKPANKKNERMARRELLYSVVREAMVKAGVLSSGYKFKVLSLDARGRQFLVMIDLSQGANADTLRLAEIEASIAQQAKARFDIIVTAVYWRSIEHVAVGDAAARPIYQAPPSRPAPLEPLPEQSPILSEHVSQPAELVAAPPERPDPFEKTSIMSRPVERPAGNGRFEPLHPDEVAAFKQALAGGSNGTAAFAASQAAAGVSAKGFDGSSKHGPQSYTLLTGFEDTEMADDSAPPGPALSATQYGELR